MKPGTRFGEFWETTFADISPAGYILRSCLPERWVRFHALPGSKRYPDNPDEMSTVIERANLLATECFPEGSQIWFVASLYNNANLQIRENWQTILRTPFALQKSFEWKHDPADEEEAGYTTFANKCTWHAGIFDEVLGHIAEDTIRSVLWISCENNRIFAPYDGGFDLILKSPDEKAHFKTLYPEWLPTGEDGL